MLESLHLNLDINRRQSFVSAADHAGDYADPTAFAAMLDRAVGTDNDEAAKPAAAAEASKQNAAADAADKQEPEAALSGEEEDTEIELTFGEVSDETDANGILSLITKQMSQNMRQNDAPAKDFADKNAYTKAVAGLSTLMKKNVEVTDGKHAAVHILNTADLSQNKAGQKIKIKVKDFDAAAKNKIAAIFREVKSGKMTKAAGLDAIAAVAAQSTTAKSILNEKNAKKADKVKITAKVEPKQTKNELIGLVTQKRSSAEAKTENHKTEKSEKIEAKKQETTNTEVSRKYEKTKKNQVTDVGTNKPQAETQPETKEFITEFSLKTENSDSEKKADVKTVLHDNRAALFDKLVENTKTVQSQNMTKFSMVMRPENVGRMDFQLTLKDGKLNGKIILQNSEAADFFRANIEEITAVFRKANVELGQFDVSLAGQQFQSEGQQFAGQSHSEGQGYAKQTLETIKAVSQLSVRATNAYESNVTPAAKTQMNYNRVNLLI